MTTSLRFLSVLILPVVLVSALPTSTLAERQGGDTIETAVLIPDLPFDSSGTIIGYANDYDESCPYPSGSPDVVYEFTPGQDLLLTVDLWGSNYDTKVWIWDENQGLVVCNDDYYWENFVSKIVAAPLLGGSTYYIIIDGHPGYEGDYVMHVQEYEACEVECPGSAVLEGEPSLFDGYYDEFNGGCLSLDHLGYALYQPITSPEFCAVSGWYQSPEHFNKDVDWFVLEMPQDGYLDITVEAEMRLIVLETNPEDCDNIWQGSRIDIAGCSQLSMIITGNPADLVYLFISPHDSEAPWYFEGNEFDYVIHSNVEPTVRVESHSWSGVKSIFR